MINAYSPILEIHRDINLTRILEDGEFGETYNMDGNNSIISVGRSEKNFINLTSKSVSRKHATFSWCSDGFGRRLMYITDGNFKFPSSNGSLINGVKLGPSGSKCLEIGDKIQCSSHETDKTQETYLFHFCILNNPKLEFLSPIHDLILDDHFNLIRNAIKTVFENENKLYEVTSSTTPLEIQSSIDRANKILMQLKANATKIKLALSALPQYKYEQTNNAVLKRRRR
jgi:pSer/pThr/pTyr-binding forkhead associated (FHA) protein